MYLWLFGSRPGRTGDDDALMRFNVGDPLSDDPLEVGEVGTVRLCVGLHFAEDITQAIK